MSHIRKVLLVVVLLALVGCDHATKHVAKSALEGRAPVTLIDGVLGIKYAENRGVAFSLLHSLPEHLSTPVLGGLGLVALLAIVTLWWKRARFSLLEHAGFAFVVAGAVGNLIDRAARGYVVDFIHLHYWPIFNVADVWIVVGAGLLAISAWRGRTAARASASDSPQGQPTPPEAQSADLP